VVAVLGAVGLTVGLALQGSLSNFAAGVMLIVLRPYKVADIVVIGKYLGRVDAIRIFQTVIITQDHREVTIPNGQIIAAPIENLSVLGHRRVDLLVSVAQAADLATVRQLLDRAVRADDRVRESPAPTIELAEITDAGMKLYVRPWTSVENYAKVAADTMERVKTAMEADKLKYSITLQAPTA
jgi:small conductance mechanosensitive channel